MQSAETVPFAIQTGRLSGQSPLLLHATHVALGLPAFAHLGLGDSQLASVVHSTQAEEEVPGPAQNLFPVDSASSTASQSVLEEQPTPQREIAVPGLRHLSVASLPQSELAAQRTQVPALAQTGVVAGQSALVVHVAVHEAIVVPGFKHVVAGGVLQSALLLQNVQREVVVPGLTQMGAAKLQSEFPLHAMHVP